MFKAVEPSSIKTRLTLTKLLVIFTDNSSGLESAFLKRKLFFALCTLALC